MKPSPTTAMRTLGGLADLAILIQPGEHEKLKLIFCLLITSPGGWLDPLSADGFEAESGVWNSDIGASLQIRDEDTAV
jgi:hypothetical protein